MARATARRVRPDGYRRRMESSLRRDAAAMAALQSFGLDDAAIRDLGLGLREPYVRSDGRMVSSVVAYPLGSTGGRMRFGCVALDGATQNPEHPVAWSVGEPATVRRGAGAAVLMVAASPVAAWRLGLAAARVGADVTVVASSQPDRMPAEWRTQRFWSRWPRVLLLAEVSPVLREAVATAARRPLEVARASAPAPSGKATCDRDDEWLTDLLDGTGRVEGVDTVVAEGPGTAEGDFAAEPIALHGGFARGHLFYPFRVERRARTGLAPDRLVHSYETLVLRGDGAILEAGVLPAPPGTPAHRRVHALSDGIRILRAPEPSRTASWSLGGIRSYAAARLDGRDPCPRGPSEIVSDVHAVITSRVSLPRASDAWLAAGFVMMSHVFRVFSALPILLIHGPKGSGKSELAGVIASLGFNGTVMGQGSAAALVRLATECGGLVVLDDVEGLAGSGGAFGDLGECLKVGYKASTSRKAFAGPTGRVEVADFFGPRVVTSTRGVDSVLGSRCLSVATAVDASPRAPSEVDLAALRDDLHALAMHRAAEVAEAYGPLAAAASTRAGEIAAPLLAAAEVLDCPEIASAVAAASQRRSRSG